MAKFKLLAGKHTQKEERDGKPVVVTYRKGDVFDSKHDLVALFNHPGAMKFEAMVPAEAASAPTPSPRVVPASTPTNSPPKVAADAGKK